MHELSITRFIDAAPDEVWDAMVNRQEMGFEDGRGTCADQLKALCEGD